MKFTIIRRLMHSELGMFHAYRDGREGSKQRAINFDGQVVDRVFPSAKDSDKIMLDCRCREDGDSIVEKQQWLKRQDKNWRLEGYCPKSPYFTFVEPGVLFAMQVDSSTLPAKASWVVIPKAHPAYEAITSHGESGRLESAGMIALFGSEGAFSMHVLGQHFPELFPESAPINAVLRDGDEPDPVGLFEILARAGHRLPSAVADLVDNSISAGSTEIDITFPNPNAGGRWMSIRDNGCGMTADELRNAMRVGSRRAYGGSDLGKFGYGLKGASWSQADCLTVISKAEDGSPSLRTWDKDHLVRTGRWEMLTDPIDPRYADFTSIPGTGTVVLLTKMRPPTEVTTIRNVDPHTVEVTELRDHLELVFHRYLEGVVKGRKKVVIRINDTELVGNNPMGHALTKSYDPRTFILNESDPAKKALISVSAYITPNDEEVERCHASEGAEAARRARERISLNGRWNETQGLYFYRLDRLIKWGGWDGLFAMDEKTKLLRVAVNFDRAADDSLQVNISKQEIRLPVTVKDLIKNIVKEPRAEARTRYALAGKKKPVDGGGKKSIGSAGNTTGVTIGKSSGTSTTTISGGAKTRTSGSGLGQIRIVDSGNAPWERKTTFNGEHVEVTPKIPELVELIRAIDDNPVAKAALSKFLRALEDAGVQKNFLDA